MSQDSSQDSIQVLVRIKPGGEDQALIFTDREVGFDRQNFGFDRIFSPDNTQEDIFDTVGRRVVNNSLEGYNSCVFVYGQTGSGKTYTMMGNNGGLMQRCFQELFIRMNELSRAECTVTCSYYELYNEQIIDLLDPKKDKKNLNLRQDVKRGMFVENLIQKSVISEDDLVECLNNGMKNRHIGETQMNRESSRSHSVFTVSLAIKSREMGRKILKTPKLHFVDLAGSERQKMTNASGDRLKEAGNINKSLTTLGMVINALASDKPKTHIPYRDSKLTCLLRDSLGGNSKTFMIATVSQSSICLQETLSTLNFANRAKMVKVKALVNQQSLESANERREWAAERVQYEQYIMDLKTEREKLVGQVEENKTSRMTIEADLSALQQQLAAAQTNYTELQQVHKDKVQELEEGWASARQVAEEHEQLKRTYKDTIKENYKLKGEYYNSSTSAVFQSTKNQQLLAKVTFYEEKFRLMSIEYNKAQQQVQRLKASQLQLRKRVEYLEENQRVQSMRLAQPQRTSQVLSSLQTENKQLKEALYRTKALNETLMRCEQREEYSKRINLENEKYELQQRQEKLRKRLEGSMRSWQQGKENHYQGMPLDQLYESWEKIEGESRRKLEGIARGIRREQKLKSQNKFILKENFYLKQKLQAVERQLSSSENSDRPRKIPKTESDCSSTNKWE